CQHGYGILTF
nr:immunoglobulin light chain junction region [Macaca mulatta]